MHGQTLLSNSALILDCSSWDCPKDSDKQDQSRFLKCTVVGLALAQLMISTLDSQQELQINPSSRVTPAPLLESISCKTYIEKQK